MTAPSETGFHALSKNFARGSESHDNSRHHGSNVMNAESEGASGVTECQSERASACHPPSDQVLAYAEPPVARTTASNRSDLPHDSFSKSTTKSASSLRMPTAFVRNRTSTPESRRSKTATTSEPLSETGNARRSSWIFSGQPCEANHSRVFFGEKEPSAVSMNPAQRGYFDSSSFFDEMPVVTLQRPHPVMATFLPIFAFPSKRVTERAFTPSSTIVAAAIIHDAPAHITAIFIRIRINGPMISAKPLTENEKRTRRPYFELLCQNGSFASACSCKCGGGQNNRSWFSVRAASSAAASLGKPSRL